MGCLNGRQGTRNLKMRFQHFQASEKLLAWLVTYQFVIRSQLIHPFTEDPYFGRRTLKEDADQRFSAGRKLGKNRRCLKKK